MKSILSNNNSPRITTHLELVEKTSIRAATIASSTLILLFLVLAHTQILVEL